MAKYYKITIDDEVFDEGLTYREACELAEEMALETYPRDENHELNYRRANYRIAYERGYKQAKKDTIAIIKDYVEKGVRCMEQSDKFQMHTFWDGFHNCAENILRELEERNEKQNT